MMGRKFPGAPASRPVWPRVAHSGKALVGQGGGKDVDGDGMSRYSFGIQNPPQFFIAALQGA